MTDADERSRSSPGDEAERALDAAISFWDVVWFIIINFAFVAYLMVPFSMLGDLMRNRDRSGAVKAVCVIASVRTTTPPPLG
jgi:hypothetical protein